MVEDPAAGRVWSAAIGGGAPAVEIDRAVPFGGLVELRYGSAPGSGDTEAPVVTLAAGDGSGRVRERALDLRIGAHDERSPVERLRVRVRVDGEPEALEPFAPVRSIVLPDRDGPYDVCAEAVDEAHNVSTPACVRVALDRAPGAPAAPPPAAGRGPAAKPGAIRITGLRARRGRLVISGSAARALPGPAVVRVAVARAVGRLCAPLAGGAARPCAEIRSRRVAGLRRWSLTLPYRGGRRRLHVVATIRQAGAPAGVAVRRGRPR